MPGTVMKSAIKSVIRWSLTLGITGSAIIGSSVIGALEVLALPQDQILQKLGPVPVFTITDNKGAPLVASVPNQKQQSGVAGVFINRQDAQAFIDRLNKKDPNLAKNVRVVPVSLGEVYKLEQANKNKPNSPDFAFVPAQQEVDAAMTLLRQSGQKVEKFNGTPLFVAKAGKKQGYLTVKQANQQVIPFFFNKGELQSMLERFKKQKPDLASTIEIQVVNLEGVLQAMQTRNDQGLNQIVLVPPRASLEFVRSLQPAAGAQNQQRSPQAPKR
jgi:nickel transport protein